MGFGDPEIPENLRIHGSNFFPASQLPWTGRCTGCTWPRHAIIAIQRFTTGSHQRCVCFWCGGGDEFEIGGGTPPRPPKICIIMYWLGILAMTQSDPLQKVFIDKVTNATLRRPRRTSHVSALLRGHRQ